jgi:hypothetical protein
MVRFSVPLVSRPGGKTILQSLPNWRLILSMRLRAEAQELMSNARLNRHIAAGLLKRAAREADDDKIMAAMVKKLEI